MTQRLILALVAALIGLSAFVMTAPSVDACCKGGGKTASGGKAPAKAPTIHGGSHATTPSHSPSSTLRSGSLRPHVSVPKSPAARPGPSRYRSSVRSAGSAASKARPATTSHYYSVGERHVTQATKDQVYRQAGVAPHTPGYVVDHRVALACGGSNDLGNLQLQTVAEGKAKDRWERQGCSSGGSRGLRRHG